MQIILASIELFLGVAFFVLLFVFRLDEKYAASFFEAYPENHWEDKDTLNARLARKYKWAHTKKSIITQVQFQVVLVAVLCLAIGTIAVITEDKIISSFFMVVFIILGVGFIAFLFLRIFFFKAVFRRRTEKR